MRVCFYIFLLINFTGCATYYTSYFPRDNTENIKIEPKIKKDISFSVSRYSEIKYNLMPQDDIVEKIRKSLSASGIFRKIRFTSIEDRTNNHLHFDIKIMPSTSKDTYVALSFISGLTLFLIPIWYNYNIDTAMFVYVDGREIDTIAAPLIITDFTWLPLLPVSSFMNHYTVEYFIKDRIIEYFTNHLMNKI